ncbi:mediator of RNA polymerase II transcription subunit 15a-like [Malus sylvestris]|uniref:mediator of RNA polymerase II transcription subunit 15a-like n=1 Tax=Malus sylvestris TaxID=3752 RepID=UPI0021AC0836|nr:mediator of RNA polymerase II transcription subunit 15a-like [Malus sylvestris]XP_050156704.1 mediator of RNA polymerase II transcription subunit 15a-like [Malus sylvestris]
MLTIETKSQTAIFLAGLDAALMDDNNQRPPEGGEPSKEAGYWRSQLQLDSRRRIIAKITDTLKRHLPFSGLEGSREVEMIAVRFEQKIYAIASSQSYYLRKISLKMLALETKSRPQCPQHPLEPETVSSLCLTSVGTHFLKMVP